MQAEDFHKQLMELEGWMVNLTSYRINGRYLAEVEAISSGVTIARATHEARAVAEQDALGAAIKRLSRTRRMDLDLTVGG